MAKSMESQTIQTFGERQRQILTQLLEEKAGLSVDELAARAGITRSAIHQHLIVLERDGYVSKKARTPQGGRPSFAWQLNQRGVHLFPKQYALFSDLLIHSLKQELGSEGLIVILRRLGGQLAQAQAARLEGKDLREQIETVVEIMRELGYQTRPAEDENSDLPLIDARNCVYHHLAGEHHEVCELDLALLSSLLHADIEHLECLVKGGRACRFRVCPRSGNFSGEN